MCKNRPNLSSIFHILIFQVLALTIPIIVVTIFHSNRTADIVDMNEQFLQFSGLGFVSLGKFHCAQIHLCLRLCILCLSVSYCIFVVLL